MRTIYAGSAVSAANYYTRYLADAPGEVPGVWSGAEAELLGLAGEVSGEDLLVLLEGRDPVSGTRLGRPFQDRYLVSGKVVRAVAGFDLTFSAPKSVSALWALTQDERILVAHDRAVAAAMAHGERFGSTTRVRADGRRLHPDSHGLVIASFRQTTSRSDDPQLHTHAVILAKVETVDRRWLALDARYIKQYQRHIGGLFQSVLRAELSHELGVAWGPIVEGQAEIVGVPVELRELYSKRSDQIEVAIRDKLVEFHSRQGRAPNRWELGAIKREAAVDTRGPTSGNGVSELVTRWADEAAAIGWTAPDLATAVATAAREHGPEPVTVDLDGIIAALSTKGSTWNRPQVMSALCDVARPQAHLTGQRWAELIEDVTDRIVGGCLELDPTDAAAPRRRSDGRSMWLEPVSAHITTNAIVREEELVLTWALDAQAAEPTESTTIDPAGLDITQAAAAAAAAGDDRLVMIVGPAGAGKTSLLRAAADDLARRGHAVVGFAPSARAARQLEHDTGVRSDTLAKLLHEWTRPDRGPLAQYAPGPGATLIVDEAGMASTPDLAQLVTLAERQHWRLVLVGDFAQLQAVGRGGLFAELCATGRVHQLERIYRFREPWQAAASLLLRDGDPSGLDDYIAHGRVVAGTFDEHLATMTDRWFQSDARGVSIALVASANDHVDQINAAIQHARITRGELDPDQMAPISTGEHAAVGDIVVTRRNDRRIITTDNGQPIRNRERWHVTAIADDGALAVSLITGRGTTVLPADYVREHVRLGYAATEHGYQGDTTTIGIELVTDATTRRGLYVGATRGTDDNLILVVTDTPDLDEARDTLERILTTDRVDVPAITQRRTLAQTDRTPAQRRLEPRVTVPEWFETLRANIHDAYTTADHKAQQAQAERAALVVRLADATHELARAEQQLAPYRPALDASSAAVRAAQERRWEAHHRQRTAGWLDRHRARREVEAVEQQYAAAVEQQTHAEHTAAPARQAINTAHAEIRSLQLSIQTTKILDRWSDAPGRARDLHQLLDALDDWHTWANGKQIPDKQLANVVKTLTSDLATKHPGCQPLAEAAHRWATDQGITLPTPTGTLMPALEVGTEM